MKDRINRFEALNASQSARKSDVRNQESELGRSQSRSMMPSQKDTKTSRLNSAKDLIVYKKAYELAMRIFGLSRQFPTEERFAITSQIRRSLRSVCLNLREAWAKRRYEAHFVSKLTDCDGLWLVGRRLGEGKR